MGVSVYSCFPVSSSEVFCLILRVRASHWTWRSPVQLGWLASKLQPSTWPVVEYGHMGLYTSCLPSETYWATCPVGGHSLENSRHQRVGEGQTQHNLARFLGCLVAAVFKFLFSKQWDFFVFRFLIVCVSLYKRANAYEYRCPESRRRPGSPGTGVISWMLGTERHSLQEQYVPLTTEPCLQLHLLAFQKGLRLASNSL